MIQLYVRGQDVLALYYAREALWARTSVCVQGQEYRHNGVYDSARSL